MKVDYLDAVLVPLGMLMLVVYHVRLAYKICKAPSTTSIGLFHMGLQAWVNTTLKDGLKNGVFVVQTMRNSIMSSCILAAAATTMTTMIGLILIYNERSIAASGKANPLLLGEGGLIVGFPIKLATLIPCFFVGALCYIHSATMYSNVSLLLGMLTHTTTPLPSVAYDRCKRSLVSASLFRFVGSRALCFSFPLLTWLYGPIAMFCTSLLIIALVYAEDSTRHAKPPRHPSSASAPTLHTLETSPLIDVGPLPPDSVCLFCPHH